MPGRLDRRTLESLVRTGDVDTVLTVFPDGYARLIDLVRRTRAGKREIETLAGDGRSCAALQEDQLCAIHGAFGEPA